MSADVITLTDDDIDDFNDALSMAYVAACMEGAGDSCDAGLHLKAQCDAILGKLCSIRKRHGGGMRLGEPEQ